MKMEEALDESSVHSSAAASFFTAFTTTTIRIFPFSSKLFSYY